MNVLIATKNPGKFDEIKGVLDDLPIDFVFLGDLDGFEDSDFAEDGETHEENAYKKARYYYDKLAEERGFDYVLGEDSGVYVDALADELGVETRRWGAGAEASDEDWLAYFMEEIGRRAGEDDSRRGAKFVCHASLIGPEGVESFYGETGGRITNEVCSEVLPGLPLSSVFLADGVDKVYAALSQEEKNEISHRGQAVSALKKWFGFKI